ncbi:MAG: guanylate kinase [Actinomycetota bacterium]|nr:guanylate kinase [Actinomycetota bacterium]
MADALCQREPGLWLSISATTRAPRPGEVDGREYVFLDPAAFDTWDENGEFVETATVYGRRYGTPRRPLEEHLAAGDDVLLEIDIQGALAVQASFPEAVLVFLRPPSRYVQGQRLEDRAADDPEEIARRLAEAEAEEAMAARFDHVVVNDRLETAVAEVAAILAGHRTPRG